MLSSSEIDRDGDSTLDRVTLALRQARDPDSSRPPEDERAPPVEREPLCAHGETVGDGHVQGTDVVPACASLGVAGTTAKQRLAAYGWQKVLGLKGKPVASSVSRMGRCTKSRRSRVRANAGCHNHCNDFEDQAANVEEWPVLRAVGCRAGLHILGCFLVGMALVLGWGGCSWESGGVGFGGQSIAAVWPDDAARPLNPERGMAVSSAGMMDSETRERPMGGRSDPQGPAVGNGRAGPVTSRTAPRTQATGGKAEPGRAEGGLVGNEFCSLVAGPGAQRGALGRVDQGGLRAGGCRRQWGDRVVRVQEGTEAPPGRRCRLSFQLQRRGTVMQRVMPPCS